MHMKKRESVIELIYEGTEKYLSKNNYDNQLLKNSRVTLNIIYIFEYRSFVQYIVTM